MRNEDFVNSLIDASPEPTDLEEVRGTPGIYYPKPADWAVRWLGFFDVIAPNGKKVLRNLPQCVISCSHCIWHTVTGARLHNEDLAEKHWTDKHTQAGRERAKRPVPLIIDYKEPPF